MGFCSKVHSPGQMEQPPWIGTSIINQELWEFSQPATWTTRERVLDPHHRDAAAWSNDSIPWSFQRCLVEGDLSSNFLGAQWPERRSPVTHKGSSVPREKTWVNEPPTYLSLYLIYLSLVGGCKMIRFLSRMLGPVVNPSDPEKTGTPMAHCHYKKEHFHKPWRSAKVSGWVLVGKAGSTCQGPFWTLQYKFPLKNMEHQFFKAHQWTTQWSSQIQQILWTSTRPSCMMLWMMAMEPIRTSILSHTALNFDMRSILHQSGVLPCRVIYIWKTMSTG